MTIPMNEVRRLLWKKADQYNDPEIGELAELTRRRRRLPPKKAKAQRITPELAEEIREYAEAHPDLPQREIGRYFNVDQGRVNEALNGQR